MSAFLIIQKDVGPAEALVVMAGESETRLPAAVAHYHQGKAPLILLTSDGILGRWSREKQRNLYQVEWAGVQIMKLGVPECAVVRLPFSRSGTVHDAMAVRAYAEKMGIRRILVVTSDYHTRRTLWVFEQVFENYPVQLGISSVHQEVCGANKVFGKLAEFKKLTVEIGKYFYYRIRY